MLEQQFSPPLGHVVYYILLIGLVQLQDQLEVLSLDVALLVDLPQESSGLGGWEGPVGVRHLRATSEFGRLLLVFHDFETIY